MAMALIRGSLSGLVVIYTHTHVHTHWTNNTNFVGRVIEKLY